MKRFDELFEELKAKMEAQDPNSGTVKELNKGVHFIGKKVIEEAGEVWIAAEYEGKEKTAAISRNGAELCARYGQIREDLLVRTVKSLSIDEEDLSNLSALMRGLSGTYDQASRAAAAS